eukprot:CAMPEP_0174757092 /NCGR_PEP_ID=MMETSP1094-20130205/107088_1 /TAXON_ID=156173 /ORGANISM="Chrysochromulina brevifilum, Strain UTEX LB 985" /LENGTH=120 /DNA_ID=CAMNT_0015963007 /DNA_START=900 /DNA_END=1263 /DNA_ORIENTATION=+
MRECEEGGGQGGVSRWRWLERGDDMTAHLVEQACECCCLVMIIKNLIKAFVANPIRGAPYEGEAARAVVNAATVAGRSGAKFSLAVSIATDPILDKGGRRASGCTAATRIPLDHVGHSPM